MILKDLCEILKGILVMLGHNEVTWYCFCFQVYFLTEFKYLGTPNIMHDYTLLCSITWYTTLATCNYLFWQAYIQNISTHEDTM